MKLDFLLHPLSFLYGMLARADRSRKMRSARSFPVPVISIGAITAGGSGKTPFTRALLRSLQSEYDIILLSRGYGRRTSEPVVWRSGEPLPDPDVTGDEPALLARSIDGGIIGVGSDRGALLESILLPGSSNSPPANPLVLLDDGFQHARLHRDLDIVIIDDRTATERFLLPAGYLREESSALERADILLATSEKALSFARRHAPKEARIFPLRFRAARAVRWATSTPTPSSVRTVLLVTGIANPERARASAEEAGYRVAKHLAFRDHHRYSERDVARILREAHDLAADIVLTTEKDAVKLERHPAFRESLHVLVLEVEIPEMAQLLEIVRRAARHKHIQPGSNQNP